MREAVLSGIRYPYVTAILRPARADCHRTAVRHSRGAGVTTRTLQPARPSTEPLPNVPSADVQLPAVRGYEQVNDEIAATLHPTVAWLISLGVAVTCMLIGVAAWLYQIYWGLGNSGYQ